MTRLTWVNHASFVVESEGVALLTDPWFAGRIFDDGWDLLVPTGHEPHELAHVTHIWISHEHPDHFHPASLRALVESPARPTVLFQPTLDGRVAEWCSDAGFPVVEPAPLSWIELAPDFAISIEPFSTLDSWAAVRVGGTTIVDLNDCPMRDAGDLARVKDHAGEIDVLVTQFGPAAWLGNPDDVAGRAERSRLQLDRLIAQVRALEPTWVVPAASFVWFAHEENSYLNENRVVVGEAAEAIETEGSTPVVLRPGEAWKIGASHDPTAAIDFYGREQSSVPGRELATSESMDVERLVDLAADLAARNRARNNVALIRMLESTGSRRLRPVTIWLWDHRIAVRFRPSRGIEIVDVDSSEADASMHSSSLAFVLRFDWGLDTLQVNGRFRTRSGDTTALTSAFWLGPWNNSGHRLGPSMVREAVGRRLSSLIPMSVVGPRGGATSRPAAITDEDRPVTVTRSRRRDVAWRAALWPLVRMPGRVFGWIRTMVELAVVERFLRGLTAAPGRDVATRRDVYDAIVSEVVGEPIRYFEFGVHQGDSIRYFSQRLPSESARFVGFDSFVGLPEDWTTDNPAGTFSTEGEVPVVDDERVSFVAGWFDQTLPERDFSGPGRLVANIDCDLYSSTRTVLEAIGPHLSSGDLVYFDEFADTGHEFRALVEWLETAELRLALVARSRHPHHVVFRVG